MIVLYGIIVAGLIYSAYNIGCIWAYKRHEQERRRVGSRLRQASDADFLDDRRAK